MDPANFREESGERLTTYYEGILNMEGASGHPRADSEIFKRKFKPKNILICA